jgi:hypothetical protein
LEHEARIAQLEAELTTMDAELAEREPCDEAPALHQMGELAESSAVDWTALAGDRCYALRRSSLRVSGPIDFLDNHPFISGLALGVLLAAAVWVRSLVLSLYGRRELGRLKELLHTKLEVEAHAHRKLSTELEDLRKQNENLRVTVSSLQQKPDRAELRQLYVYDIAIRSLHSRLSGFGPAWQAELDEAERQMSERETGIGAFVRRVLSPRPTRVLSEPTIVDEPKPRS